MQKSKLQFKIQKFLEKTFKFSTSSQQGYIALVALLVVASAGLTLGIAVSLSGIDEIQVSLSKSQAAKAQSLANACIEEGLERLRASGSGFSGSLSVDGNSCIINTVTSGSNYTLHATGTIDIYSKKAEVEVDSNLDVIYWAEE